MHTFIPIHYITSNVGLKIPKRLILMLPPEVMEDPGRRLPLDFISSSIFSLVLCLNAVVISNCDCSAWCRLWLLILSHNDRVFFVSLSISLSLVSSTCISQYYKYRKLSTILYPYKQMYPYKGVPHKWLLLYVHETLMQIYNNIG